MTFLVLAALATGLGSRVDTSYGRVDGDIILSFGLGTTITPRSPMGTIDLRARYLDTAGVFVTYEEGFGGPAQPARVLVIGAEARPLFWVRWLADKEIGVPFVDLLIDSFAFELGVAMLQPQTGHFADRFALQAGIGLEAPLFGRAQGLWIGLHGGARFSEIGLAWERQTALEQSAYLAITLSWHQPIKTHAVDIGDLRRE